VLYGNQPLGQRASHKFEKGVYNYVFNYVQPWNNKYTQWRSIEECAYHFPKSAPDTKKKTNTVNNKSIIKKN